MQQLRTVACLAVLLTLLLGPRDALAKLTESEWRAAKSEFKRLFTQRGHAKEKAALLRGIALDGTGRAWRLMADALFKEVMLLDGLRMEHAAKSKRYVELTQKGGRAGWTAFEESEVKTLQAELKDLGAASKTERATLLVVTEAVVEGPELLRQYILQRAKSGSEWTARAAALRVAVMTMKEKASKAFVLRALKNDKDSRVRMAGLDALAVAPEGHENLVIGRLADPAWPVVLRATDILRQRDVKKAIPHLINALNGASPRVGVALGAALRKLTGENFEFYADIWNWWEDNKSDFKFDVASKKGKQDKFVRVDFFGVPIKSDRILFIIDVSGSMKLKTRNDNPKESWKPPPMKKGGKAPPPPPPPEEILSGPKIRVAQHELKKAIKRLPKNYMFNMIKFNHGAAYWQSAMQKASAKNKERALEWVRRLKPGGSNYIDGALRMGFTLAGLINYEERPADIAIDTIVLLSDGAPTDSSFPVSKLMKPEVILEHVREWNKEKLVIIHCIGVDMVDGMGYLQKLAAENGGVYVNR